MTEPLMKIATQPPAIVPMSGSVRDAVAAMVEAGTGAVSVIKDCKIVGVFTERDLLAKVVNKGLDPDATAVSGLMAPTPICVSPTTSRSEAVELMVKNKFRHLPIADETGCLLGMLSLRDLLGHQLTRLRDEVSSLELYLSVDGPGG